MSAGQTTFERLMTLLADRKRTLPEGSYTTRLLQGGVEKIGEKVVEEAAEVVEAAGEPGPPGREHLAYEAADLIYHLMVLLTHCNVTWQEIGEELARREGTSGLKEKASRTRDDNG